MTKDFVSIAYHGFRESVNQERFLSIWNPVALSDGILFLKKNTTQRCGDFFENRRLDLLFPKPAAIPLHLHDNG